MNDKKLLRLVILLIAIRTWLNWFINDRANKKAQSIIDNSKEAIILQINTRIADFLPEIENTIDNKFSQSINCEVIDK